MDKYNGIDKPISKVKGEEDMQAVLKKQCSNKQECLDLISSKLKVVKCTDGTIILDRNNKKHVEWYNDTDNGGK